MKRFARCIAFLMALLILFVPPVSASSFEGQSNWVNILNYDLGTYHSNYISFKESGSLTYTLPNATFFRYLQGVVQCNSDNLTSMTWSRANSATRYGLTLIPLGNGLYRFYSEYNSLASDTINLHFNSTSSGTVYAEVVQFEYCLLRSWNYSDVGKMSVTYKGNVTDYSMESVNDPLYHYFTSDANQLLAKFTSDNWKKYDYLTFFIYGVNFDINTISARHGSFDVPLEYDFVFPDSYYANERYSIVATLDLSNIDRNSASLPYLEISGGTNVSDSTSFVALLSVSGNVSVEEIDLIPYLLKTYLGSIGDKIDTFYAETYSLLMTHFRENFEFFELTLSDIVSRLENLLGFYDNSSDGFEDHMESQATEMEEITDVIDSVTKPSLEEMNPSVDDIVSADDISDYSSILQVFFSNQIFLSVCVMSLTLGLVSYTLYGKR